MSRTKNQDWSDDDAFYDGRRRMYFHQRKERGSHHGVSDHVVADEIARYSRDGQLTDGEGLHPSLNASHYEREWILTYLGGFYMEHYITDVLHRVKGGKEANVYCCAAHPKTGMDLIAAKLYRPSMFRNLRNDARYRQNRELLDARGKTVRDRRALLAARQNTNVGKEIRHTSWLEHEFATLQTLSQAGADVPRPVICDANTILMEYFGEAGMPAPALNEVSLPAAEAKPLFDRLVWNIELMLSHGKIHGDLSAYNVLYWDGRFTIIDFPQAIDPLANPDAWPIFERDVLRVCLYFTRYNIRVNARQLARGIWDQQRMNDRIRSQEELINDLMG